MIDDPKNDFLYAVVVTTLFLAVTALALMAAASYYVR